MIPESYGFSTNFKYQNGTKKVNLKLVLFKDLLFVVFFVVD